MIALADIIAHELANPVGRSLSERLLQAMFMMERFRGKDAGWRDLVSEVADADIGADAIAHLAQALRRFIVAHRNHPDVGTAIWALGALYADEDAQLFDSVLADGSGYSTFAREQAKFILGVIRP
jgi:hypothetical protein